jgi:hypothetical protein
MALGAGDCRLQVLHNAVVRVTASAAGVAIQLLYVRCMIENGSRLIHVAVTFVAGGMLVQGHAQVVALGAGAFTASLSVALSVQSLYVPLMIKEH